MLMWLGAASIVSTLAGCGGREIVDNKAVPGTDGHVSLLSATELEQERQRVSQVKSVEFGRNSSALKREQTQETDALLQRKAKLLTPSHSLWKGFRRQYPYHLQTLAVSKTSRDQSRTIVISEPPPHVTIRNIVHAVGPTLRNHSIEVQKFGHGVDGWVKDVVLGVVANDAQMASIVSNLNHLLFYTSYKSYVLPLPTKRARPDTNSLDLQVSSSEIKQWLLTTKESFVPVQGGSALQAEALFQEKFPEVYLNQSRTVVGWWLPKAYPVADANVQARQFAIESDLIIGAIGNDQGVFILGRARQEPVDVLPPLRVETLITLASVPQGQRALAQSYERTALFAGKLNDKRDWAPILLSPELRDTEYGSLLNITDQLLKGWSQHNEVTYENFHYPPPHKYPFDNKTLREYLGNPKSLTFNWNTAGAAYTIADGPYTIFAVNRCGALPVSYFPEDSGGGDKSTPDSVAAQRRAYNYYASLSDPNLVRVVQYAALYQIFDNYHLAKPKSRVIPLATDANPDLVLERLENETLQNLRAMSAGDISALSKRMVRRLRKVEGITSSTGAAEERFWDILTGVSSETLEKDLLEVKAMTLGSKSNFRDVVEKKLSSTQKESLEHTLTRLAGHKGVPERYSSYIEKRAWRNQNTWIHTPVIVVSDAEMLTGGHNLDAAVLRLRYDSSVKPGQSRVDPKGYLLLNPADASKARSVASEVVGRRDLLDGTLDGMGGVAQKVAQRVTSRLKATKSQAPRVPAQALHTKPAAPPEATGHTVPVSRQNGGDRPTQKLGWAPDARRGKATDIFLADENQHLVAWQDSHSTISVFLHPDGQIVLMRGNPPVRIVSRTYEDAADAFSQLSWHQAERGEQVRANMHGFDLRGSVNFRESCCARMGRNAQNPLEIPGFSFKSKRGNKIGVAELKNTEMDWSKARYSEVHYRQTKTHIIAEFTLEVPTVRKVNGRTIVGKIKTVLQVIFDKAVPKRVRDYVEAEIKNAYIKLSGQPLDAYHFLFEFNKETTRICKEVGLNASDVKQHVQADAGDLFIAKRFDKPDAFEPDSLETQEAPQNGSEAELPSNRQNVC